MARWICVEVQGASEQGSEKWRVRAEEWEAEWVLRTVCMDSEWQWRVADKVPSGNKKGLKRVGGMLNETERSS